MGVDEWGCKFQGQLIAKKEALLRCLLFAILKIRCIYEIKQPESCSWWTFSNHENGVFRKNHAYYVKCWQLFFTTVMSYQVIYYQQGVGKGSSDQQIAASGWHCS